MRVVLIGDQFEDSENLAMAMLDASLRDRGHRLRQVSLPTINLIDDCGYEALRFKPGLIGVSVNYQVSAITALATIHFLRKAGFRGHIVVGGAFATLHIEELFRDCPMDSLILFEGEHSLADLADQLDSGTAQLEHIAGLIVRSGNKLLRMAPAAVWKEPYSNWAARPSATHRHLGVGSATMVGSRGCNYRCTFCSIAALGVSAAKHARKGGHTGKIPATKFRSVVDVANEMTYLRREHDVQLFRFEDDCLLGNSPEEAYRYASELKEILDQRHLGTIGLTLKVRPDSLDERSVEALKELGLIHTFVGFEALTDASLRRMNRAYRSATCQRALEALRRHEIPAYFNALVIGPDATTETLRADLRALSTVSDLPFEIVKLVLYKETALFRRLHQRGSVRGNYLAWRYRFDDEQVGAVSQLLSSIATRRTGAYGPAKQLADLEFNLAVAERFNPNREIAHLKAIAQSMVAEANASAVELTTQLIDIAEAFGDPDDRLRRSEGVLQRAASYDASLDRRISAALARLETAVTPTGEPRTSSFLRSGLAAAAVSVQLAFVPVGADTVESPQVAQAPVDEEASSLPSDVVEDSEAVCESVSLNSAPVFPAMSTCGVSTTFCDIVTVRVKVDEMGRVVDVHGDVSSVSGECIRDALAGVCFQIPETTANTFEVHSYGPCD